MFLDQAHLKQDVYQDVLTSIDKMQLHVKKWRIFI